MIIIPENATTTATATTATSLMELLSLTWNGARSMYG